jgi:dTDP-4-dehydrorhamnose 3,5-epimerase
MHGDHRGFLHEVYRKNVYADFGIADDFVQDNHSRSRRGILRGLHFQPGMAKLVWCPRGAVFDVVVDLRRGSPTFGEWESFELDDETGRQVYCPDGFGHGFCVLSAEADVVYMCSTYYDAEAQGAVHYDDPEIGIKWPEVEVTVSQRDSEAPRLREVSDSLPFDYRPR